MTVSLGDQSPGGCRDDFPDGTAAPQTSASPRNGPRKPEGRGGPSCLPVVKALLPWGRLESCLLDNHSSAEQQSHWCWAQSPFSLPPVTITAHLAPPWNGAGELINTISHKVAVPVGKMELCELSVFVPCAVVLS